MIMMTTKTKISTVTIYGNYWKEMTENLFHALCNTYIKMTWNNWKLFVGKNLFGQQLKRNETYNFGGHYMHQNVF